eukprot:8590927-Pyramimonas_sp.AAC.1
MTHHPCNMKCPGPTPAQEVEFSTVLMIQDAYHAGAPAGGSDGSWVQAQSADVTGITSSGIAPSDTLYVNHSCTETASTCRATCFICSSEQSYHTIWYSTECWEH